MITTSSIFQSNLLESLYDSQTKKPFVNAQIVNCKGGHSFSLETAQRLFGNIINNAHPKSPLCEKPNSCPHCPFSVVTSYSPNTQLQTLVNAVLKPEVVVNYDPSNEEINSSRKYPFEPFDFFLKPNEDKNGDICIRTTWDFRFEAKSKDSPVHSFQIFVFIQTPFWNKDKEPPEFFLNVFFEDYIEAEKFMIYAQNQGIKMTRSDMNVSIETNDCESYLKFIETFLSCNLFNEKELAHYKSQMKEMFDSYKSAVKELGKQ
jgi:hypothetical protein